MATTITTGLAAFDREERAQALVSAARALFPRQGYQQTSLADLAVWAGLTASQAEELFPDKAAVFGALVERSIKVAGILGPDVDAGVDEDLPGRLARTYLSLWEPTDGEESPLVEIYRIALSDREASAVLRERITRMLNSQVDGALPVEEAELRTAVFGAHLGGIALWRHLIGIGPLADAPLPGLLTLLAPALRSELLGDGDLEN